MSKRYLPVRPDLDQLKHQAKDLLRAMHRGDPDAVAELAEHHPEKIEPANAKLADAQLVLAHMCDAPSWPRVVLACRLIDAIWRDDIEEVRAIVVAHPKLLHESARIEKGCNWGPPMSYAANLGRDEIIRMLYKLGATDLEHALDRATLQSRVGTARVIHEMMGAPRPSAELLVGPAYTLSPSGTALMLELGAPLVDEKGNRLAPVNVVIEADSRRPKDKHAILEMYVRHGFELPDTPVMALHRGRHDLLEAHLVRDPNLLRRTFTHAEIYPPEMGCGESLEVIGTPLDGATLLHLCVEYDELDIARWLLDRGMDVDVPAAIDADGFGGHTALFSTVVCYANYWRNFRSASGDSPFAPLLLEYGARRDARASIRKVDYETRVVYDYRDVTPVEYGERYYKRSIVSESAIRLIAGE